MTVNEISLFILATVILIVGLYINTHREEKPQYKRPRRSIYTRRS